MSVPVATALFSRGRLECAQRCELGAGRRLRPLEVAGDAQRPPGRRAHVVDLDAGMDLRQRELATVFSSTAGLEDAEVGDDDGDVVAAARTEVEPLDERARALAQHH